MVARWSPLVALVFGLGSCSPRDTAVRGPEDSVDPPDSPADTGASAQLVDVTHEREFRAVWVATVANINFPSKQSLAAAEQKAELVSILDTMVDSGLNAIVFQVRPEGDALYASTLEPWSRFLTGTQGKDPGYDPLAYLIDEAHARNIEVHAWFNPYRAKSDKNSQSVAPHMSVQWPEHAHVYGANLWMDPGAPAVQDRLVAVIEDVVTRYDVDGIHFDDYFYPYPDGTPFPDAATYAAHGAGMSRDDWRRDNVNEMVRRVSAAIAAVDPDVRFGISPFGIYRPGQPPGISGLDQYAEIYSDPKRWTDEGWLDYLAPQLYWPSTQSAQAYGPLIAWWSDLPQRGQYTFAGNFLSKLGSSGSWSVDEFRTQVALSRQHRERGSQGNIFFHVQPLQKNQSGIRDVFRDELYVTPALTPPMWTRKDVSVAPPSVEANGVTVTVDHPDRGALRSWVIYADAGGTWKIDRVLPATSATFDLGAGRWAVSAAGRHGVESRGVVVEIP